MKRSKKYFYCISSTFFATKEEALEQIADWDKLDTLKSDARVVKVKEILKPVHQYLLEPEQVNE